MAEFEKLIYGKNWWPSPCVDCGAVSRLRQSHTRCIRCHRINAAVKRCEDEVSGCIRRLIQGDERRRRREAKAALSPHDYQVWLKADRLMKRATSELLSIHQPDLTSAGRGDIGYTQ